MNIHIKNICEEFKQIEKENKKNSTITDEVIEKGRQYTYLIGIRNKDKREEFTVICNRNYQSIIFHYNIPLLDPRSHYALTIKDCSRKKLMDELHKIKDVIEDKCNMKGIWIETAVIKRHKDYKKI